VECEATYRDAIGVLLADALGLCSPLLERAVTVLVHCRQCAAAVVVLTAAAFVSKLSCHTKKHSSR